MSEPRVIVHYQRNGFATYAEGRLTTNHSRASYKQPVIVIDGTFRTTDPYRPGMAIGIADLGNNPGISDVHYVAEAEDIAAVVAAGYSPVEARVY
jgi:hypothetical protein